MVRRTSTLLIAALIVLIAAVLYWQWHMYKGETPAMNSLQIEADQRIMIKTEQNSLQITQTFEKLPENSSFKVNVPAAARNQKWTCIKRNEKPCDTAADGGFVPDGGELSIRYIIPLKYNQTSFRLSEWNVNLEKVDIRSTKMEIVDNSFRSGTWVTAYPLKGHRTLKYIDYWAFEGKGSVVPLYWQKSPLYTAGSVSQIQFYSKNPGENLTAILPENLATVGSPMAIIKTDYTSPMITDGLMIVSSDLTMEDTRKLWLKNDLNILFKKNGAEQDWQPDTFLSLYLHQTPKTPKGKFIVDQLKQGLAPEQLEQLVTSVLQQRLKNARDLDALIAGMNGMKTNFFESNVKHSDSLVPLVFYDRRPLYVNGKKMDKVYGLYVGQRLFLPFKETMQRLGFQVQAEAGNSIQCVKNNKKYLFFLNKHSFLLNGQKYGLLNDPFIEKEGMLYISQDAFQSIFKVRVIKDSSRILIME